MVKKTSKARTSEVRFSLNVIDELQNGTKPLMIYFAMSSKGKTIKACRALENWALTSASVVKLSGKFKKAKMDLSTLAKTDLKRLVKKFKLKSCPTILFVAYNGKQLYRLTGKVTPKRLLATMKKILAINKALLKREQRNKKKKKKAKS